MNLQAASILHRDCGYPARSRERLGDAAPAQLTTLGNLDLLALLKTGLFCSARLAPAHPRRTADSDGRTGDLIG